MTFNSLEYALLLLVVVLICWSVRRRGQNAILLAASYLFYGAWDWRFLSLLLFSTVVDWTVGRALGRTEREGRRRLLLSVSMVGNLGVLAAFKYFGFFVESARGVLERLGIGADLPTLDVILPVGISFYTFQTMSYTIDVFRRRMEPERDLATFALFVSFFPQLVAGPIERATRLLPQLRQRRPRPPREQIWSGLTLILLGLAKKVAIADALSPAVSRAFEGADLGSASWVQLVVGAYLFAVVIYADFSAYTDIARGSARLLGIELMENFAQPYLSRNITVFWRTWHISLSTWLRDYLYIPLGGNQKGRRRTEINLLLVMLLGGLWHGAAWTFVIWGAMHGVFLAAHRALGGEKRAAVGRVRLSDAAAIFGTFNLVCLAWIFFRADSLGGALRYLGGILTLQGGDVDADALALLILAGAVLLFVDIAQRNTGDHTVMLRWEAVPRGLFYGVSVVAILLFSGASPVPFIYFQF